MSVCEVGQTRTRGGGGKLALVSQSLLSDLVCLIINQLLGFVREGATHAASSGVRQVDAAPRLNAAPLNPRFPSDQTSAPSWLRVDFWINKLVHRQRAGAVLFYFFEKLIFVHVKIIRGVGGWGG